MSTPSTTSTRRHVTVIKNGRIIDTHTGINSVGNVYIENGRISMIEVPKHGQQNSSGSSSTTTVCQNADKNDCHAATRKADILDSPAATTQSVANTDCPSATAVNSNNKDDDDDGCVQDNNDNPAARCHGDSSGDVLSVDYTYLDASGCVVTPGLVDCHVHAYQYATPLGIDVDRTCLHRGVTTAVDAGSAGSSTFEGFNKLIRENCRTRLYAFLHIAKHGLAAAACSGLTPGGECDSLNAVDPETCCDVIRQHRDVIVGVKVRLAASISDEGRNEQEMLRRALQAAEQGNVPLMVHHALSTVSHEGPGDLLGCPGNLRRGDILTHCYHGHQSNILDPNTGRVSRACWDAKRRGVIFDLGHGQGSFSWELAEQCVSEGLWPDTISTDLHTESVKGPSYTLLCTMTKMLHLGMPLEDVIAATTCRPAAAIGKLEDIGHLTPGMWADITILKLVHLEPGIDLEDSFGETRSIKESIELVGVLQKGVQQPVFTLRPWPNPATVRECLARRNTYKAV